MKVGQNTSDIAANSAALELVTPVPIGTASDAISTAQMTIDEIGGAANSFIPW